MGFLDNLRRFFRRVRREPLPLEIEMDLDDLGNYQVTFFTALPEGREQIRDLERLLDYGYQETSPDGRIIYALKPDDRQALLALKSLNPRSVSYTHLRAHET